MTRHLASLAVVDLFCGAGGTSEGVKSALGVDPLVAVNHDANAIACHRLNHKGTIHLQKDVHDVRPKEVARCAGRKIDLLCASPDCGHFSRARGGKPADSKIRDLGWVVVDWAREVQPRVILVENVPEYVTWGPLYPSDHPDEALRDRAIPEQAGETFDAWVTALRLAGYAVEWRTLSACDYGAPTTRKRLYVLARCDGQPIVWPEPTHGPGRAHPWRTAAECIDWSIPCPSIFERRKELAEATQRRIAEGMRRFVFEAAEPFIVPVKTWGGGGNDPRSINMPMRTITTSKGGEYAVVAPTLIQTGYGEAPGQRPRCLDLQAPLGTVVAAGAKHALVGAWLTKFWGTAGSGSPIDAPVSTITSGGGRGGGHAAVVQAAFVAKHYTGVVGHPPDRPLGTVTAVDHHSLVTATLGPHAANAHKVAAFVLKYYGQGSQHSDLREPMHTIVTKARMGLVTVTLGGEEYAVTDIGLRMLEPHELALAQGFPASYQFEGTKADKIARIGHSVSPPVAAALVRANVGWAA